MHGARAGRVRGRAAGPALRGEGRALGALGALGASKLGPKAVRVAAKSGKLRPVNEAKLDSFSRGAEKTSNQLAVTGAGIGGVGGYNFASYTRAEAKQRKKKLQ